MATWEQFETAAPELASRVRAAFTGHRHHTMATVRRDGGPRLSGTEVDLSDGRLALGMMTGTWRAADLRRDPRLELHSQGVDPPVDDQSAWVGEARVSGTAVAAPIPVDAAEPYDLFVVDISDVVFTRVGTPADHLLIERWTPHGGVTWRERR